ncbi:VPLPA-CTERM sorting domain-containing protein [Duganella sp. FT135W]|uniref:VPLPA-CTERM sorting domain-containing protein n=1 Tax=Duganella flavida TaxID=2692175 RepID=A0A6L8KII6_9BURK|nr:VPLPA-CTERM sorting domain-containing protein [Duganella flavida]MYM24331.1 VPLPA-CTERM sorting domain-containing protein [Duganella flavida]
MHLTLRKAAAAACLLFAAAGAAQAAAPLDHAVISASYSAAGMLSIGDDYAGSPVSGLDPLNTSVEFISADFLFGFDFAPDGQLTIYNNGAIPAGSYVASFDFGGSLGAAINGFSVTDAGVTGGVPVLSVVDGHTIRIDLSAVEWNGDYNPLRTAITLQAAQVPEPAAAWMLAAGLLGLATQTRRRS